MKAAMYLRKSRAEEISDTVEDTLKRHKETLTELARLNGILITGVYEEVVSGENLFTRPQMLRLLADVERGDYDAVLCMDIDRLGRGAMSDQGILLETLKAANTKIITPRKIYDLNNDIDETYSEFESFLARQELKVIKRRMRRGIKRTIEDGGYIANAPYGYKRIYIDKRPSLEIVPEEAEIVRMMFDLYSNKGYGCQRISDAVNAIGAKPRRSNAFVRISVMKILKNPVYTGKIVWNQKSRVQKGTKDNQKTKIVYHPREDWTVVKGIHKPIIEEELFNKAQDIITRRAHPPVNTGKVENPLAGLVYCSRCGAPMQRQVTRHGGECLICQKRGCMVSSSLPLVEKAVLRTLRERLSGLSLTAENSRKPGQNENREIRKQIIEERRTVNRQTERLHDLLEQDVYTVETYCTRQKALTEKLEQLEKAEKKILSEAQEPNPNLQYTAIKNILELYAAADRQEQNELLKSVVGRILYDKQKGAKPGEFHLTIFFISLSL